MFFIHKNSKFCLLFCICLAFIRKWAFLLSGMRLLIFMVLQKMSSPSSWATFTVEELTRATWTRWRARSSRPICCRWSTWSTSQSTNFTSCATWQIALTCISLLLHIVTSIYTRESIGNSVLALRLVESALKDLFIEGMVYLCHKDNIW